MSFFIKVQHNAITLLRDRDSAWWLAGPGMGLAVALSWSISTGLVQGWLLIGVFLALILSVMFIGSLAIAGQAGLLVLVAVLIGLPELQVPGIPFDVPAVMPIALLGFSILLVARGGWSSGGIGLLFLLFLLAQSASWVWGEMVSGPTTEQLRSVNASNIHLNQYRGLWQIGGWVLGFGVFLFAVNHLRNISHVHLLVKSLIVVGLLVALFGYYELLARYFDLPYIYPSSKGHTFQPVAVIEYNGIVFPRIYSSFQEPKILGHFLLIPIFLSLSWWASTSSKKYLGISAVILGALIPTFSTTAWAGLVIGLVVWITVVGSQVRRRILRRVLPLVPFGIVLLIALSLVATDWYSVLNSAINLQFARILGLSGDSTIVSSDYINGWRLGLELFRSSSLLGVGIGNSPFFSGVSEYVQTPYSLFLLLLAETGILGFTLFLALIGIPCWRVLRSISRSRTPAPSTETLILAGGLAAFVGGMVTYAAYGGARFYLEDWLVLALLVQTSRFLNAAVPAEEETP